MWAAAEPDEELEMAIIRRIGMPENDSETRAIRRLAKGLPDSYLVFHNFELTTGRGLPYEYDIAVLAPHALYHVEVKGYRGLIRGNSQQWVFENGSVYPSPIPLANKKTKILASKLRQHSRRLDDVFVDTLLLLTDDDAKIKINDDQVGRVLHVRQALQRLEDPAQLPVAGGNVTPLYDLVCGAMSMNRPTKRVQQIGLYDVLLKVDQDDRFTTFLTQHRYIETCPKTLLKVYHLDVYASDEEKQYRIREIFHGQDAMRLLGTHPNLVRTGDMFAWNDDSFVEPQEYLDQGMSLETLLDKDVVAKATWEVKTRAIRALAAGLKHAHRHGVIHRDVRPRNILVAPHCIKLGNFDLAYIPDAPNLSIAKTVREHFDRRYVAPAVWLDPRDAVPASDIYSLGLVFYTVLTGQPPRHDVEVVLETNESAIDVQLLEHELSRSDSPHFTKDPTVAAQVIARMCAPQRSDRYASFEEVLEDLAIVDA
jgi:serine/threonine protein kinase